MFEKYSLFFHGRRLPERGYDDSAAARAETAQREETGGRKREDARPSSEFSIYRALIFAASDGLFVRKSTVTRGNGVEPRSDDTNNCCGTRHVESCCGYEWRLTRIRLVS